MALHEDALSIDVVDDLAQRLGHENVAHLSAEKAFDEWCAWHGLGGWGPELRRVWQMLQAAEKTARRGD